MAARISPRNSIPATTAAYGTSPTVTPDAMADQRGSTGATTHHTAAGTPAASTGRSHAPSR